MPTDETRASQPRCGADERVVTPIVPPEPAHVDQLKINQPPHELPENAVLNGPHLLSTRPSGLGLSINEAHAADQAESSG